MRRAASPQSGPSMCGIVPGSAEAMQSTLREISWHIELMTMRSPVRSRRRQRPMATVDRARRRFEDTMREFSAVSPRRQEITSATVGLLEPGAASRNEAISSAWSIPSTFSGVSKKYEYGLAKIRASRKQARTMREMKPRLKPRLKTSFQADSPWRMKTMRLLYCLGSSLAVWSAGWDHFESWLATI